MWKYIYKIYFIENYLQNQKKRKGKEKSIESL